MTKLLDITAFAGVTLKVAGVDMVNYVDSGDQPLVRVVTLENGAKFDIDGLGDADEVLGQVIVRYKITSPSPGMDAINAKLAVFNSIRKKRGTLTGIEKGALGNTTFTCSARCRGPRMVAYTVFDNPPLDGDYRQKMLIDVTWEKMSAWA